MQLEGLCRESPEALREDAVECLGLRDSFDCSEVRGRSQVRQVPPFPRVSDLVVRNRHGVFEGRPHEVDLVGRLQKQGFVLGCKGLTRQARDNVEQAIVRDLLIPAGHPLEAHVG